MINTAGSIINLSILTHIDKRNHTVDLHLIKERTFVIQPKEYGIYIYI